MMFEPDKCFHVVLVTETLHITAFVFPHPTRKIVRETCVQCPIPLRGENIDEVVMISHIRTIQEQSIFVIPENAQAFIRDLVCFNFETLGPGYFRSA